MGRGSVKSKGGGYRNFMHIVKYEPWRFHQKGFKSLRKKIREINVGDIEKLIKEKDVKEVNVWDLGFGKVTGRGQIKKALTISAPAFTKVAKEKIEKAGGKAAVLGGTAKKVVEEQKSGDEVE